MRSLSRPAEPRAWQDWRRTNPGVQDFAAVDPDAKQAAREVLSANQACLCAYCESRIGPDAARLRFEHWLPQSDPACDPVDWRNLLGVCWDGLRASAPDRDPVAPYCETARRDTPLHHHPYRDPKLEARFSYDRDGIVRGADQDARDDIETLKLNHPLLCANRRVVYERLQASLRRSGRSAAELRRVRARWSTPGAQGDLPEFVSTALHHLDRWLRKAGQ
jgi:uncharacterized protein (TIGR02646 family)